MSDHAQGDTTATMRKPEYERVVDEQAFLRKGEPSNTCRATMFDLTLEDRRRVAEMISELATTSERVEILETHLAAVGENDEKYKQKCNKLMKKVDVMTEKVLSLESEKAQITVKHGKNLAALQATVTNISKQFEKSMEEMEVLRKSYFVLENENKRLRAELNKASSTLTAALKERAEKESKAKTFGTSCEANLAKTPSRQPFDSTIKSCQTGTGTQNEGLQQRGNNFEDELVEKVFFKF